MLIVRPSSAHISVLNHTIITTTKKHATFLILGKSLTVGHDPRSASFFCEKMEARVILSDVVEARAAGAR